MYEPNLNTEIAVERDVVGLFGDEVVASFEHHLTLLPIEIGGQSRQIELREEGTLQHRVHAMHRAQLRLLYRVVQNSTIARTFQPPHWRSVLIHPIRKLSG